MLLAPTRGAPASIYQSTFTPSCTCRASNVLVMLPKFAALRLAAGGAKLSRLKRLKASTRSCSLAAPPRPMFLLAAASNCQKFGPRTLLRGALPNGWLGSVGIDTHCVLNQLVIDCCPAGAYGSQVRFGRKLFAPEK